MIYEQKEHAVGIRIVGGLGMGRVPYCMAGRVVLQAGAGRVSWG